MGNKQSTPASNEQHLFARELGKLNHIVDSIVSEQDMFKDRAYNFLSQDVCDQHFVLMESELNRHLKVELEGVGQSLYLVPKNGESNSINKKDLCKRISNHYMKILYILCLVKYVFNLEQQGERSIAGIMFRNTKIVDDLMELNFCNVPHKDYSKPVKDAHRIDFSKLEGLEFFTKYFLEEKESLAFLKIMRKVLARSPKRVLQKGFCEYVSQSKPTVEHLKALEKTFIDRYSEAPRCEQKGGAVNLYMYVEKDNPVFSKEHCYEVHKYIIKLNTPTGSKVRLAYDMMVKNYKENIRSIEQLVGEVVLQNKDGSLRLKDISKDHLDVIIVKVKDVIKTFYIQSLMDFQNLLDVGKTVPNINMMK